MTIDVRSVRSGRGGATGTARPTGRRHRHRHRLIMLGIEVDAVAHLLRNRRFREQVIVTGIVLAALKRINREARSRAFARLYAWDKRRNPRAAQARPSV